jgi:hypothetical protein
MNKCSCDNYTEKTCRICNYPICDTCKDIRRNILDCKNREYCIPCAPEYSEVYWIGDSKDSCVVS